MSIKGITHQAGVVELDADYDKVTGLDRGVQLSRVWNGRGYRWRWCNVIDIGRSDKVTAADVEWIAPERVEYTVSGRKMEWIQSAIMYLQEFGPAPFMQIHHGAGIPLSTLSRMLNSREEFVKVGDEWSVYDA